MLVGVLLSVSFYTLFERKVLGLSHLRLGPNVVSVLGLMQPFSDAVKLFMKEIVSPMKINYYLFFLSPAVAVISSLVNWSIFPYESSIFSLKYLILLFFIFTALGVYSHLAIGWSSNSNYALIGSLRAVAQSISYEVSLAFLLILILMNY